MESNIYYDLAQTKLALDAAERVIRSQKGKLFGKNLLIAGSLWLFWETAKMLDKASKELKQEKERADSAEAALAEAQMRFDEMDRKDADASLWCEQTGEEKDICCDGKASITKNDV